MTNKLVVIINSLEVTKIKKILLYEKKFLVPNHSCLQNPWLGGYRPPSTRSLSSVLNWICWTPPPETKFLGTPLRPSSQYLDSLLRLPTACKDKAQYLKDSIWTRWVLVQAFYQKKRNKQGEAINNKLLCKIHQIKITGPDNKTKKNL